MIPELFRKLNLDLKTAIYTSLALPLLFLLKKILLKHVKEWIEFLWEGCMFLLSRYIKHSLAATLSMKRYCRLQLGNESIKYLHIPSSLDINLDIDKVFVNMTISYVDEQERNLNHKDFLVIGNRIKVMGDPGAGKSSLIKKVFRDCCEQGIKKPSKTRLPVYIELKTIVTPTKRSVDLGKWLYDHIKSELSKNDVYKMDECFDNYATTRGVLVLLDGLDEVSSANYNVTSKCINEFSRYLNTLSPQNTIVLTMRTQFYQQIKDDFNDNFRHATFLKPFTPSDVYEFLTRWHFQKNAERNISRIYKDLTDRPTLREMCSNPLILSMYVAEDQISKGNISPESRTQFYKKVTEELIINRRLMQKSALTPSLSYSSLKDQREQILGKIAYNHLTNVTEPRNNLSWKNAISVIKQIMKCDNEKASTIFYEISKETGLITEERYKETFRFIHLTFCEFLAAFEVAQGIENGWVELLTYHKRIATTNEGKSRLIEVIPFTAGLLPRVKRDQALRDIKQLNDITLMSRCFLETKYYGHEGWADYIENSKKHLLNRFENKFNESWLQDLHLFNVVVRDANLASEHIGAGQQIDLSLFYEQLLDKDKTILNEILVAFASQDAAAVFRLCEISNINLVGEFPSLIIQNCDQVPLLGLIKDKILENNMESEAWINVLVESALRKRLISRLLNDMSKNEDLGIKIRNGNYRIWYHKNYVRETFFTQCVTLSSTSEEQPFLKCIPLLMDLKSPFENRYKLAFGNAIVLSVPILLAVLYFTLTLKYDSFRASSYRSILFFILGIMAYALAFFSMATKVSYKILYDVALNFTSADILNAKKSKPYTKVIFLELLIRFQKKSRNILYKMAEIRGEL